LVPKLPGVAGAVVGTILGFNKLSANRLNDDIRLTCGRMMTEHSVPKQRVFRDLDEVERRLPAE
jgi:hypothetical protein